MRLRLLLTLALLVPRVAAQEEDAAHSQIFVESDSVAPYFARAKTMERDKDFRGLFTLYQTILAKYPDRVWELEPGRYVGVRQHILRRMREYPPAAIKMYREMLDPDAEVIWQRYIEKGNEADLQTLVDRYALTRRGEEAGRLLAALSSLRGDPSQSLSLWGRMAADPAAAPADRARGILRVALLAQRNGLAERVEWASAQVTPELAAVPVSIGGRELSLAEAIAVVKATPPLRRVVASAEDWPSPGGAATNDAVGSGSACGDKTVVAWTWPPSQGPIPEGQGPPANVAFAPAIANGILYYCDGQTVAAIEVATGKPLWKSAKGGLDHAEDFLAHLARFASTRQEVALGCTVDGDTVYACNVTPPEDNGAQAGSSFLSAYTISKQLAIRFTQARDGFPKGAIATAPPLVRGDRVFVPCVLLAGNEPQAFVACLSATTGKPAWPKSPVFVCGAMEPGNNNDQTAGGVPAAFLAAGGGKIFVQTNLGGIAALSESTGEVIWITDYYRLMSHPVHPRPIASAEVMSLPVLRGDTLWCLPKDSGLLLALDAETGAMRQAPRVVEGAHALMGLLGEEAIVLAEQKNVEQVLAIGLAEGTPTRPSIRIQLPLAGRGFITSTFVFVPTANKLCRFDTRTWALKSDREWPKEAGGHVLVVGETVISIGKRITGLCTQESYRERFRSKFEQGLPEPWMERGRSYWQNGSMFDASQDLEKALSLCVLRGTRVETPPAAEVRSTLAALYLEWGRKMATAKDEGAAASCFAWSASRQDDPELRIIPLLALADLHAKARRWPRFVGCLSRVLAEAPDAPTKPEEGLSVRAGDLAAGRLRGLRAAIGDAPFAAYDAEAEAAAVAAEKLTGDEAAAAWKATLSRYPSAPAAAKAEEALANDGAVDGRARLVRLLESADRAAGQARGAEALARLSKEALAAGDAGLAEWALLALESGYERKQAVGGSTVAEFVKKGRAELPSPAAEPAVPFPPKKTGEVVLPEKTMDDSTEAVALPMVTPVRVDGRLPYELRNYAGFLEARRPGTDEVAWKVVDDRGWLGVKLQDDRKTNRVLLQEVIDGEPAAAGGLQTGDYVEAVDGIAVSQTDHVIQLIAARADRPTVFRILRNGEQQEVTVTLGDRGLRRGERVDQALATPTGRLLLRRARRMQMVDPDDGTILWSYPLPGGEDPKAPHISSLDGCWSSWGRVYVLAVTSAPQVQSQSIVRLACLDETTGGTIWQRDLTARFAAMVPVGADLVGVLSGNDELLLVDARTGETRGEPVRVMVSQTHMEIAGASAGGLLYCVTPSGALKALDPSHVREVWTQKIAGLDAGTLFDFAVGEGVVWLARARHGIEAFDPVTGERRGEGKIMDGAGGASLSIGPGPIALATFPAGDGWQLSALDLARKPPASSWEVHFARAKELTVGHVDGEHVFVRLTLTPDAVQAPAPANLAIGIARATGKREWEEGIPNGRGAPRVSAQGGRMFMSLDDRMTIYGK